MSAATADATANANAQIKHESLKENGSGEPATLENTRGSLTAVNMTTATEHVGASQVFLAHHCYFSFKG